MSRDLHPEDLRGTELDRGTDARGRGLNRAPGEFRHTNELTMRVAGAGLQVAQSMQPEK